MPGILDEMKKFLEESNRMHIFEDEIENLNSKVTESVVNSLLTNETADRVSLISSYHFTQISLENKWILPGSRQCLIYEAIPNFTAKCDKGSERKLRALSLWSREAHI